MPNYTLNILTINSNKKTVKKILSDIKTKNTVIDFDKIIPQPDCIKKTYPTSGRTADVAQQIWDKCKKENKANKDSFVSILTSDEYKEERNRWDAFATSFLAKNPNYIPKTPGENYAEKFNDGVMKFLPNLEETGYADWYGWCRANWGTKWNACDPEVIDDNIIEFYTAWAPPLPIFFALAKKYQDAEFIVEINDECDPYVVTMRFAYDKKTNTVKDEFLGRERAYDDDDIEENTKEA